MGDVEQFQFGEDEVRVIDVDGEPWFVASDVCAILGHTNTSVALRMLDDDEKQTVERSRRSNTLNSADPLFGDARVQSRVLVSEPGLYTLILRSNVPAARQFKRWLTHEVLPAIRRTGIYRATTVDVDSAIAKRLAEIAYKEHVVPASARVLAFQRWRKPQKGMEAFGEVCIQLELDISPLAPAIGARGREVTSGKPDVEGMQ